jgi:AcrR family transcriptional regulator
MATAVNPRRSYHSPLRREQADATRHAILEAARALFLERGYVATPIATIADRAEVSPATIYQTFGNKRSVLVRLVDISIAGDEAPIPVADRPWVRALSDEPDLRLRIRILAWNGAAILRRRAPIDAVVASAAATDPEIATLWRQMRDERHAGQARLLKIVAGGVPLRREAADVLYAIGSPETYRAFVVDRGWSPARFERWYAQAIERLLLEA